MAMFPYPSPTAMALDNLTSQSGADKPKKPVLYRAGRAVGSGLDAAHQVAGAVDRSVDNGIASGVDAAKLGVSNFVRGVQGQPELDSLPKATAAASPAGNAPAAKPVVVSNAGLDKLKADGAIPSFAPPGRLPVAPQLRRADGSGIDTGVTLPDGRALPYGSMVKGVPTFSDGSGGIPGQAPAIPRTMTNQDIASLGQQLNTVPAAALTRAAPAFNSDNSEANIEAIQRSKQGGRFGVTPDMNANADIAAVANQDARSTLGRAALNAGRRAGAATSTLQRKSALEDLSGLREGVTKNAALGIDNAAAQGRANTDAQATLQRQGIANIGALDQQALQNEGELARTDLAGKYGVATALANPKKAGLMTDKDYLTQLDKGVQTQIKTYNDQQALLPAEQRQPLTDAAIAEMRAIQAKALGLRVGTAANGQRVVQINGRVVPL